MICCMATGISLSYTPLINNKGLILHPELATTSLERIIIVLQSCLKEIEAGDYEPLLLFKTSVAIRLGLVRLQVEYNAADIYKFYSQSKLEPQRNSYAAEAVNIMREAVALLQLYRHRADLHSYTIPMAYEVRRDTARYLWKYLLELQVSSKDGMESTVLDIEFESRMLGVDIFRETMLEYGSSHKHADNVKLVEWAYQLYHASSRLRNDSGPFALASYVPTVQLCTSAMSKCSAIPIDMLLTLYIELAKQRTELRMVSVLTNMHKAILKYAKNLVGAPAVAAVPVEEPPAVAGKLSWGKLHGSKL